MSRIDDLIRQHSPDGVQTRPIGEIGVLVRGNGIQKSDFVDEGVGCIHYGQIHTHYGTWATETKSFVTAELAAKTRQADPGDLVIATTSEDDEAVGKAMAWLGSESVAVSTDAFILRHSMDPKFVAYFFQTEQFQAQKRKHVTGAKVRRISGEALAKINIPVPPLEVQLEIVRVLDLFQSLEAELEAELEARRRQYAHYRDSLLDFTERGGVRWMTVGELEDEKIVKLGRGSVISRGDLASTPGEYPVYSSSASGDGEFGRYGKYMFDDERITWSVDGGGKFFHRKRHRYSVTNVCGWMTVDNESVRTRFIYHALSQAWSHQIFDYTRKAHPSVIRSVYTIPIPTIEEQDRLISILDGFDQLINDISIGLPAELAARRSQYEYYRDRLLTFEEAA